MKLQFKNRTEKQEVNLRPKEITLLMGSTVGQNVRDSLGHAHELLSYVNTGSVLYINTALSPWKIEDAKRKSLPDEENIVGDYYLEGGIPRIYFMTCDTGDLHREKENVLNYVRHKGVRTIIINSWEWAASNSRVRETLLYQLRGFNGGDKYPKFDQERFDNNDPNGAFIFDFYPATVLIYAQETGANIELEKIQKRGFGKLAAITDQVVKLDVLKIENGELKIEKREQGIVNEEDKIENFELRIEKKEVESSGVDSQSANQKLETILQNSGTDFSPSERTEVRSTVSLVLPDDPRIGTEDEPGISDEEAQERFVARMKPIMQREKEARMRELGIDHFELGRDGVPIIPAKIESNRTETSGTESSRADSQSASEKLETILQNSGTDFSPSERTEVRSTVTNPTIAQPTSIEELRKPAYRTPDRLAQMPIHVNNYSPDKTPEPNINTLRPNHHSPITKPERVQSDVVQE